MQLEKRNIVILTYVAVFSLIVPAIFWFSDSPQRLRSSKKTNFWQREKADTSNRSEFGRTPLAIEQRIGIGEKVLIAANRSAQKEAAAEDFAADNSSFAY